jgi:hypothetical protein
VKEIHFKKRDSSSLSFPCFQTNARFDSSMSGGPVFSQSGNLCGIICSSMPPFNESEEHVSYAACLWPLMGTIIDIDRYNHPHGLKYPLLELAQENILNTLNWEKVKIYLDDKQNVKNIGIDIPKFKYDQIN